MSTTWTKITKASGTAWTKINKVFGTARYGYAIYGTDRYGANTSWTKIAKPSIGTSLTWSNASMTWSSENVTWASTGGSGGWTKIPKAS